MRNPFAVHPLDKNLWRQNRKFTRVARWMVFHRPALTIVPIRNIDHRYLHLWSPFNHKSILDIHIRLYWRSFHSHFTAYTSVDDVLSITLFRESQYHVDYPGYDPSQHPRQPAAIPKDEQRPYMPPTQKMDTMTVTQVVRDKNLDDQLAVFVARFSTDWYQCFATYSTGADETVSVGQRWNRSDGKYHYVSLPLSSVWTS